MTDAPVQTPPKKDTTWIWILAVVLVLCLCCALLAFVAGVLYVRQNGFNPPRLFFATPTAPAQIPVPTTGTAAPLAVRPYDPSMGQFPTLQNLVPNWKASTVPGVQTWQLSVSASQPALVFLGWCAVDQATLQANYLHLVWSVLVDGTSVPVKSLYVETGPGQQGYCQGYAGLISTWPMGRHEIETTMHLDQSINDGWNSYPAGDYVDVYQISVTP